MNKFRLQGTVSIKGIKEYRKGEAVGRVLRFTINYKVNSRKNTVFSCSTFVPEIIEGLKDKDVIELIDYIPVSDKTTDVNGNASYFNSLIVREIQWVNNSHQESVGALEQEFMFGNFDVNSYQENQGQDDAEVEVPMEVNQQEDVINVEELLK